MEYQKNELIDFINYTYENSPYYRELYKNIDNINTLNDRDGVVAQTGGTTGKSLVVHFSKEDMMKRMAMLDHFKSRVGFEHLKMRRATFNGQHIVPPSQKVKNFWRYNAACKQMIYSSFNITEENIKYYVESLNKFKPHAIDGFFTSMLDIAGYIERHNIELTFQPVAIFPTSETLTDTGRELLERVFRCRVYDQYASSEGAPFVTECEEQALHVELNSGVFEHLDGGSSEILVTSFTTHGTPLIRYEIGDAMVFNEGEINCSCGLHSPTVKEIHGRKLDFIYASDGAKVNGGNVANIFKNIPNAIIKAQLIQKTLGEITILLEVDNNLYKESYDQLIINECKHKFGNTTKINIEHVKEIPREKSGKFKMIKNNVMNL